MMLESTPHQVSLMARIRQRKAASKSADVLEAELTATRTKQMQRELREARKQYPLLWECYRTGQVNECQWQQHLQDPAFAAWVEKQERRRPPKAALPRVDVSDPPFK